VLSVPLQKLVIEVEKVKLNNVSGEKHQIGSFSKVLEWIFQNTNDLQKKPEEKDQKSLSSVSVPGAVLFSEPFLRDLDLIWRVHSKIDTVEIENN